MSGNKNCELVSVIVPVYNVINYVDRCVESIIVQEYTNLEIILVDDGSNDGSEQKCDYYATIDKRIQVVHKNNGGLSDARNVGLEHSKGELVTFVDSDDWISKKYIQVMYDNLKNYCADISGCHFEYAFDGTRTTEINKAVSVNKWTSEEALRALLQQDRFTTSAWGLLIRRQLFDGIKFPLGKYYEDLGTVYKLLHRAKIIVHSDQRLYYYYQRIGSIQGERYSKRHYDELVIMQELYDFVRYWYPNILYAARERLVGVCFHLILMMDSFDRHSVPEANEMIRIIKANRWKVIIDFRTTLKVKCGCILSIFGLDVVEVVYKRFKIKGRIDI